MMQTEEEEYAILLIQEFKRGYLKETPSSGTTLRAYLAEKLRCEPMRITKKFAGDASIGKHVYQLVSCVSSPGYALPIRYRRHI